MDTKFKIRFPLALAIVASLAGVCGTHSAFANEGVRHEKVTFPDLNLETSEGIQALYTRIHTAALRVCSEPDPIMKPAVSRCMRRAEGDAVAKINASRLTAFYQAKTKSYTARQQLIASR